MARTTYQGQRSGKRKKKGTFEGRVTKTSPAWKPGKVRKGRTVEVLPGGKKPPRRTVEVLPGGGPTVTPPRSDVTRPSPKTKAEQKFASKSKLERKPGETDEAYAKRQETHVEDRKKLTKSMLEKSGSKYNDDYSRAERNKLQEARESFQKLGKRKEKLSEKASAADLTPEQKAAIEAKLSTVKTERKEANAALADNRDARRAEAVKQYVKQVRNKRNGESVTLFSDKDRVKRLKKARRAKRKKQKGTYSVT